MESLPADLLARVLSLLPLDKRKIQLQAVCVRWKSVLLLAASHEMHTSSSERWTYSVKCEGEQELYEKCSLQLLKVLPKWIEPWDRRLQAGNLSAIRDVRVDPILQSFPNLALPNVLSSVQQVSILCGRRLPPTFCRTFIQPQRLPVLEKLSLAGLEPQNYDLNLSGFCHLKQLCCGAIGGTLPNCIRIPQQCQIILRLHASILTFEHEVSHVVNSGLGQCHHMLISCDGWNREDIVYETVSLKAFSPLRHLENLYLEFNDLSGAHVYIITDASCLSSSVQQVTCSIVRCPEGAAVGAILEDGWQMSCGHGKRQWVLSRPTQS